MGALYCQCRQCADWCLTNHMGRLCKVCVNKNIQTNGIMMKNISSLPKENNLIKRMVHSFYKFIKRCFTIKPSVDQDNLYWISKVCAEKPIDDRDNIGGGLTLIIKVNQAIKELRYCERDGIRFYDKPILNSLSNDEIKTLHGAINEIMRGENSNKKKVINNLVDIMTGMRGTLPVKESLDCLIKILNELEAELEAYKFLRDHF